jgi:hypothetical protein
MRLLMVIILIIIINVAGLLACNPRASQPAEPVITPTIEIIPNPTPVLSPLPPETEALVYFLSMGRFAIGVEPYEEPVLRSFPSDVSLPQAVLQSYFEGPTEEERARGLDVITSGFSGVKQLDMQAGTAHVYLDGNCASLGAAYNIAQLIMVNLLQFEEIHAVKIYDEHGETGDPTGPGSSIPFCLEP